MRRAIALRRVDPARADMDRFLEIDAQRRSLQQEIDGLNSQKKELARLGRTDPGAARRKGQELRERGRELETRLAELTSEWQAILEWFPNWPHPDMPEGAGEEANVEECAWLPGRGYLPPDRLGAGPHSAAAMPGGAVHGEGDFEPRDHSELSAALGADTPAGLQGLGLALHLPDRGSGAHAVRPAAAARRRDAAPGLRDDGAAPARARARPPRHLPFPRGPRPGLRHPRPTTWRRGRSSSSWARRSRPTSATSWTAPSTRPTCP